MTDQQLKTNKVHGSHEEAMRCYKRYLIMKGYTQISPREFLLPDKSSVLVLSKVSHFGGIMRKGKNEKGSKKRIMPRDGRGLVY